MANGSFRVLIRKRGKEISRNFNDLSTAELWSKYKEDLIDQMHAFDVPAKDLITIADLIEMKNKDLLSKGAKDIGDVINLKKSFSEFLDKYASDSYFK